VHALQSWADQFAQGSFRTLTQAQRDVVRALSAHLTTLVRGLCACAACRSQHGASVPAQLALSLRFALDANLHTCIVTNPLYDLILHVQGGAIAEAPVEALSHHAVRDASSVVAAAFALLPAERVHNMGFALYRAASLFNHSCEPNAHLVPTSAPVRARVVAIRPIADGGEVRIAYVDTGLSKVDRQSALEHYGFECDCPRCREKVEA
jgi:hypothetical protein